MFVHISVVGSGDVEFLHTRDAMLFIFGYDASQHRFQLYPAYFGSRCLLFARVTE